MTDTIHPDEILMEDASGVPERFENLSKKGIFGRFFGGLKLALSGIGFTLKHKSLRRLAVVPTLIHIGLFAGLLFTGFSYFNDILEWAQIIHVAPEETGPVAWMLRIAAGTWSVLVGTAVSVVFFLAGVLGSALMGHVLCGPVYDALSERTEILVLGRSHAPDFSFKQMFSDIFQDLMTQGFRLLLYLSGLITIFLLGLVPVIGQVIAPVLSMLWTWLFFSLTFSDPSYVRHGIGANARLGTVFDEKFINLGFGMGSWMMCLLFPLLAPCLVVAGTRKYLALASHDKVPSRLTEGDKVLLRMEGKKDRPLLMAEEDLPEPQEMLFMDDD